MISIILINKKKYNYLNISQKIYSLAVDKLNAMSEIKITEKIVITLAPIYHVDKFFKASSKNPSLIQDLVNNITNFCKISTR